MNVVQVATEAAFEPLPVGTKGGMCHVSKLRLILAILSTRVNAQKKPWPSGPRKTSKTKRSVHEKLE